MTNCPICGRFTPEFSSGGNALVKCFNCGDYTLTSSAEVELSLSYGGDDVRAKISYAVRRQQGRAVVSSTFLREVVANTVLPSALEMLDNLVVDMATAQRPGLPRDLRADEVIALAGASSLEAAEWAIQELQETGLVRGRPQRDGNAMCLRGAVLSTAGWARYDELVRQGVRSRIAFMAMKFGDAQLTALFNDHLKAAVASTGFTLRKHDEVASAGLIDNRMRVDIRTSRFMVCDLSHGNRGAYWEAGFAEGIGRPVIYICREDVFTDSHADRPHFDASHQTIIKWNPASPAIAAQQLKDMIRATLPAEAKMED